MPNPNYPVLTKEQKTRKQAIRNWKRQQAELVEYCKFASICQVVYNKQQKQSVDREMKSAYDNLCYSIRDILSEHDKQDEALYNSEVLCESVVNYLYI